MSTKEDKKTTAETTKDEKKLPDIPYALMWEKLKIDIQHKNRSGSLLYWVDDPAGAQVVNGYYEKDGRRLTTTTTDTGWPVYVYDYLEAQTMQITF